MAQELMPWEDPPTPAARTKEAMPWEDSVPSVTSRVVRYDMPEPPGAPKIAVQPVPVPPGFGQRVYEQTLQGPVELAKGLKADPVGTLKQTAAHLFGISQYQTILKQLQAGQYLPAAISILSFKNPAQMQAEAMTTPFIEDVRTGNWGGATGNVVGGAIALAGPKILSKVPGAAKVTGAGVRAAAPDVAGGALKVGAGALMEHMLPGPSPLKYAFEGYTGYAGARQIGRGLNKGVAATRQALRDRATAAAEALAKERNAAAQAARPGPVPVERQLPPGATRMPPAADTSGVRSVPGEYAAPEPLPPSRQLAAPGRPAIVTPAPDPLAGDTSGVRAVPAVYGTSAVNEAATGMREAMGLQPGELAPPATRPAPITARASQIDQMARHMRQSGITATQAALLDPPELAALAQAAGIEGPLGKVSVAVRKRLAAMEKAEAETAKYQAAWDKLKPAEKAAVTGEAEAPAVERKPPASASVAEPAVTTPAEANVELGRQYPAPAPVEGPAAPTASQRRVKGVSEWLAEDPMGEELARLIETDPGARLLLEQQSQKLGHGRIAPGEIDQIVGEVRRLQENPPATPLQERLQTLGDEARDRVRNSGVIQGSTLSSLFPAEVTKDMITWGAARIANGAIDFGKWSKAMLADAKDISPAAAAKVRGMLPELWEGANKEYQRHIKTIGTISDLSKIMEYYRAGKKGKDWYTFVKPAMQPFFGKNTDLFLKMFAATSPNTVVTQNVRNAIKAYRQFVTGQPFEGFMQAHLDNLNRAVADVPMSGPKVGAFGPNMLGDLTPVTVDLWIARAIFGRDTVTPAQFKLADYMISQAAKKAGLKPAEMQAAVWTGIKKIMKSRDTAAPPEVIIREYLAKNPDVASLFKDALKMSPEHFKGLQSKQAPAKPPLTMRSLIGVREPGPML